MPPPSTRLDYSSFFSSPSSSSFNRSDDENGINCEVCLEPFLPSLRPPKLLPCGHNFCEQCLFSIYCHQQYYLLDSVSCPTCRRSFSSSTAISAPTNFDLCKLLESFARSRDNNITMIRLNDDTNTAEKSFVLNSATNKKSRKEAVIRCVDCNRRLSQKSISRTARTCIKCVQGGFLVLSCLECCVDRHNGHELLSRNQVETEQTRASEEQNRLYNMASEMAEAIRRSHNSKTGALSRLAAAQICTVREAMSELHSGVVVLSGERLLAPRSIYGIRRLACQHVSKLSTLVKLIENEFATLEARKSLSGSQLRQSRLRIRGSESLAKESLAAVLTVLPSSTVHHARLSELLFSISPHDSIDDRITLYIEACAIITQTLAVFGVHPSAIPLISDAFVHLLHEMSELSRKRIGSTRLARKAPSRAVIWKQAHSAYGELLRVVAKLFDSSHPARVEVIDDFSFVCRLFADVVDTQGSVTICSIELERSKAAGVDAERLKNVEENLQEARRLQKLRALRQNQTGGNLLIRAFTSCVKRDSADHETTYC